MRPEEVKGLGLVMIDAERQRRAMMEEQQPEPKSGSQLIKEWLLDKNIGFTFTLPDVHENTTATPGAASGFVHRLQEEGYVSKSGVPGSRYSTYTLLKDVSSLYVQGASAGGIQGRKVIRNPTTGDLAERLVEIASQLELIRSPLSSYTTAELLAEIGRRAS